MTNPTTPAVEATKPVPTTINGIDYYTKKQAEEVSGISSAFIGNLAEQGRASAAYVKLGDMKDEDYKGFRGVIKNEKGHILIPVTSLEAHMAKVGGAGAKRDPNGRVCRKVWLTDQEVLDFKAKGLRVEPAYDYAKNKAYRLRKANKTATAAVEGADAEGAVEDEGETEEE